MKKIIFAFAVLATSYASAQVGVGNTDPKATLDVTGVTTTTVPDGVLVPRFTVAELNTKAAAYGADQNAALVFVTDFSGAAGKTADVNAVGFYFYDHANSKWKAVGGASTPAYQSIRGTVTTVTAATYTLQPTDYAIITNNATGVTITMPTDLTAADAGRTVFIFNDNTAAMANSFAGTTPSGVQTHNQFRAMELMWTGTKWVIMGK